MSSEVFIGRRRMNPLSKYLAVLHDYELAFNEEGIRYMEPCFASIIKKSGAQVQGVLYELTSQDIARLHTTEGSSYGVEDVDVTVPDVGQMRAITYVNQKPCDGRHPSRRYMKILINGAIEHGLPDSYVKELRQIKTYYFPVISELSNLLFFVAGWYISKGKKLPFASLGASRVEERDGHQ